MLTQLGKIERQMEKDGSSDSGRAELHELLTNMRSELLFKVISERERNTPVSHCNLQTCRSPKGGRNFLKM